jgi:hypothetical protein
VNLFLRSVQTNLNGIYACPPTTATASRFSLQE